MGRDPAARAWALSRALSALARRVLERVQLVVQIVDARNPLLFRCPDLESYAAEIDARKFDDDTTRRLQDRLDAEQPAAWTEPARGAPRSGRFPSN